MEKDHLVCQLSSRRRFEHGQTNRSLEHCTLLQQSFAGGQLSAVIWPEILVVAMIEG